MNCPTLIAGVNYKETDDYPFVSLRKMAVTLPYDLGAKFLLKTGNQVLGYHDRGVLTVCEGYASDTYSPCIKRPWYIPGKSRYLHVTPVPKSAGFAPAILHDMTRQFFPVPGCPWTREDCDDWFYNMLLAGGESELIAGIYHEAVAGLTGDLWIAATRSSNAALSIQRTAY